MEEGMLGIIRVGGKAVRFYEPPVRPDFAWVALPDIMKVAGFPAVLTEDSYRRQFAIAEAKSAEGVVIVPHLVALPITQVAKTIRQRVKNLEEEYWKANAEATKLMFLGMSEDERQAFIRDALTYNERFSLMSTVKPSIIDRIKTLILGVVPSKGRRRS